ncbi:hypothetical protein ACHAWF_004381 [Thalassiosira exigua]
MTAGLSSLARAELCWKRGKTVNRGALSLLSSTSPLFSSLPLPLASFPFARSPWVASNSLLSSSLASLGVLGKKLRADRNDVAPSERRADHERRSLVAGIGIVDDRTSRRDSDPPPSPSSPRRSGASARPSSAPSPARSSACPSPLRADARLRSKI